MLKHFNGYCKRVFIFDITYNVQYATAFQVCSTMYITDMFKFILRLFTLIGVANSRT